MNLLFAQRLMRLSRSTMSMSRTTRVQKVRASLQTPRTRNPKRRLNCPLSLTHISTIKRINDSSSSYTFSRIVNLLRRIRVRKSSCALSVCSGGGHKYSILRLLEFCCGGFLFLCFMDSNLTIYSRTWLYS